MNKFKTITLGKHRIEQSKVLGKKELSYIMGGYSSAECAAVGKVLIHCVHTFFYEEFCAYGCENIGCCF